MPVNKVVRCREEVLHGQKKTREECRGSAFKIQLLDFFIL